MKREICVIALVVAFLMAFGAAAVTNAEQTYLVADKYEPSTSMPAYVYAVPVGTTNSIMIRLPATYDPSSVPLAILWLNIDNIKVQKMASMAINGHPLEITSDMIGPDIGHKGCIKLDPSFLKPGGNELKIILTDNLNGTTGGWGIIDAFIAIARPGAPVTRANFPHGTVDTNINVHGVGTLALYDSSLDPKLVVMSRNKELGWKEHWVRKGVGKNKWSLMRTECQLLSAGNTYNTEGGMIMPFGLAQTDNGEVILLATLIENNGGQQIVTAFSKDKGDTWTDWHVIRGAYGRPIMLAYLGKGNLAFESDQWYVSSDYGRTWEGRYPILPPPGGTFWAIEGNPLVDMDASGNAAWMAEAGCSYSPADTPPSGNGWPGIPGDGYIRWSEDGGKTWVNTVHPTEWYWEETVGGKTYKHGINEASLVRAKNGWIIAAMRTDVSARYTSQDPLFRPGNMGSGIFFNDSLDGTGVSVSKDNGKTWSPIKRIFEAGRHHADLRLLPNGDILMTVIVRADVRDGKLASYNRGCDALISHDNGLTWNPDKRIILDEYVFYDGRMWFNGECGHICSTVLDDGRILTTYGNYSAKGAVLIRWSPPNK